MNKKKAALLIAVLAAVCLMLSGCGELPQGEKIAKKAWDSVQEHKLGKPEDVLIMRYTGIKNMYEGKDGSELSDRIRRQMPTGGYCVMIGPPQDMYGFSGMHAVLFNTNEELIFDFDYTAQQLLYEETNPSTYSIYNIDQIDKATKYLQDCTYFASMYNDAREANKARALTNNDLESNVWYSLSTDQINRLFR